MDWNAFLYLLLVICATYAPYKFLQRTGGLLHISAKRATILAVIFFTSILLLLRSFNFSSIETNLYIFTLLGLLVTLWFLAPRLLPFIGVYPRKILEPPSKLAIISAHPPVLFLKFFEVIFQEVFFLYLLSVVFDGFSLADRIIWFTIINVLIHAINIIFVRHIIVLWITILSIPMGILFSYLILHGYILVTVMIHLGFYLALTTYFWTNKRYSA
ncbi:MAG: hypothetical protein O3B87_00925 [bacterium]|nr:hypothetical protein [bacterium]